MMTENPYSRKRKKKRERKRERQATKKGLSPLSLASGIENRSTVSSAVKSTNEACVSIPL